MGLQQSLGDTGICGLGLRDSLELLHFPDSAWSGQDSGQPLSLWGLGSWSVWTAALRWARAVTCHLAPQEQFSPVQRPDLHLQEGRAPSSPVPRSHAAAWEEGLGQGRAGQDAPGTALTLCNQQALGG